MHINYSFGYWNQTKKITKKLEKFYCSYCNSSCKTGYIDCDTEHQMCYLCYICNNFVSGFIENVILCRSDLSQTEINEYTINFISKYKRVPQLNEIDPDAYIINQISPLHFVLYNSNHMPEQYANNKYNKQKYKLFFSEKINLDEVLPRYFGSSFICY